jgi:uncharacterized protein
MKKQLIFLVFAIVISSSLILAAESLPNYYDKYLNDFGKIFNAEETTALRTILYETDINTTAEIVVVTVESVGTYTPSEYALALFDKWKVGKVDKDNGLIILYAVKENKIWAASGYGLEGILPDSKLGRLLDDYYVPLRDKNQTKEGIILFTQEVLKIINQNRDEVLSANAGASNNSASIFSAIIFGLVVIIIATFLIKRMSKNPKIKKIKNEKNSTIRKILDFLFFIVMIAIFIIGFNIFLLILFVMIIIIRAALGGGSSSAPFWIGGGSGFSGGGGFGGGGFGGGMSGGGGAGR